MPDYALRPCAGPGCANLVKTRGELCKSCARKRDGQRGSASSRGYGVRWRSFLGWWRNQIVTLGGVVVCGATMPGGPVTTDSECRRRGVLNDKSLHFDHEPPLSDAERTNPNAVCDARRIQALCASCHARKTLREQRRAS
jgi:hypothetical protein